MNVKTTLKERHSCELHSE